jgi:dihydrofolate reductase
MSKVFNAHAVSVDGYLSGGDPSDADGGFGRGLGDAPMLFDWYFDGETPSRVFGGFRPSKPSGRLFDALAGRVGAAVAGRVTYEHSSRFAGGSPHPTAPLFVLSHRPVPEISDRQTLVTTGIADAIAAAGEAAGDKDVALMGGGVLSAALEANLVDEVLR